jgi:hypothetical protein
VVVRPPARSRPAPAPLPGIPRRVAPPVPCRVAWSPVPSFITTRPDLGACP